MHWQLSEEDSLIFWLKTINTTGYGFQYHQIRLGNLCGGYYKYSGSPSVLNSANGTWKRIKMPLAGGGSPYNYVRTAVGNVSFDDISYLSIHADTWDFGFEIWLDDVHFSSFPTGVGEPINTGSGFTCYPNPTNGTLHILIPGGSSQESLVKLYDITGRIVYTGELNKLPQSGNEWNLELPALQPGLYLISLTSGEKENIARIIIE
jgi:hypothetical protein